MSRLNQIFARCAEQDRAALVIYLCAGDPDIATTVRLMHAAADAGADVIEVGMPFSDPTADGPVIQRASERALASGTTLAGVLEAVAEVRQTRDVGIVLFGYYNPIVAFGEAALARAASQAGVDGCLIVDLPVEESAGLVAALRAEQLDFVPLVAPTTPDSRVDRIAQTAGSFLYYVSLTGVTGAQADLAAAGERAAAVARRTGRPVALGFGIKTAADAAVAARTAAGVVVGSAVCTEIERAESPDDAVQRVSGLVEALRGACVR